MTLPATTQRMTRPLLAIAATVVLCAFALWETNRAAAVLVGALLSVANWFVLRFLASRMAASESGPSPLLALLSIAKMGLLIAIVFVLINRVGLDALGLLAGLSVLFVGPVIAGLVAAPALNSQVRSVREER